MERKREKLMAGELDEPPQDEAAKEEWIREYAKVLDALKAENPAECVLHLLMNSAQVHATDAAPRQRAESRLRRFRFRCCARSLRSRTTCHLCGVIALVLLPSRMH
jgi:hypothetical protein